NHIVVAASAWGGRIVTIIIQFYSIRLLLQLLGTDGYAAFTILVSLSGWLLLADIGIGNSLQNKISARRSEKNNYHDLILSAAILIVPIIFIISIIIYLLSPMLSGFLLSNFDFMSEPQKKSVFLLACLIYILTTLGTVSFKIWYAEKIGWLSNLIPVFSTTLGFVLLQIFTTMNHESQTYSLLFYAITTFYIPAAVIGIGTFCYQIVFSLYKGFLPSKTTALVLFNKGCGFFYFAIMAALIFQIDYIIMAKKITGEELVIYAIFSKIFGLTNFIYTSLLQAIWPMCAEANTKKEWDLYYQIGRKYIALGFGLVIFCSVG
ncbi:TPA: MATE family efflux transporter, partial [Yersinia enterocolitica]|nr:MATE family efflux transporter [Yersinia enterocolitica]